MNINFKRSPTAWALALMAVAMVAFAAACGGSDPEDLTFDVAIEHDAWDVANDIIKVKQGDTVTVNVESDVQGGFHLHGYDLYNEVAPDAPMSFSFVADATGNFEIQFHKFTMASDKPSDEKMADGEMAEGDHEEDEHAEDEHAEDEHAEDEHTGEHDGEGETELHLGSLQVFPR